MLDAWSKPAPAVPATTDATERGWADQPDQPSNEPGDDSAAVVEVPGTRDDRPHHVRMHDAFSDVLKSVLNSGDLPACGGTPAAIVWHIDNEVLRSRYGFAVSEHGTLLPVGDALRVCDQSALYVLIENSKGVPLYLGRTARIASPGQTIALAARDRGCSFPGCDRPPSHCQRHHVIDWLPHGPTDIDNLTLLCGYHHRELAKRGWECADAQKGCRTGDRPPGSTPPRHPSATRGTSPCPTPDDPKVRRPTPAQHRGAPSLTNRRRRVLGESGQASRSSRG